MNPNHPNAPLPVALALALTTALALLATSTLSCGSGEPAPDASIGDRAEPASGRVIVIGIDGASPRIVFPMIRDGKLPNLAAIARDGASGPLRSLLPISSPIIWNTIATGKDPEKHGITSFAKKQDGEHQLYLSTDRKVHALWNIVSEAGRSVSIVNMWNTYPPEKIDGVVVSDHLLARQVKGRRALSRAGPAPVGEVIYPSAWHDRLSKVLESGTTVADGFEDPYKDNYDLPPWLTKNTLKGNLPMQQLSRRYQEDEALARIALEIEREIQPGLTMVLLTGIDRVSHFLWGFTEPDELYTPGLRAKPGAKATAAHALHYHYEFTDALIGKLTEGFGPNDLVVVLSDHGFEAGQEFMLLTGVHEGEKAVDGVMFARGPGIAPGTRIEGLGVADVTPTILAWMDLPVGRDMDGEVAPFLAAEPRHIATYDKTPIKHVTTAPSGVEADIVEQLRGLGYLE